MPRKYRKSSYFINQNIVDPPKQPIRHPVISLALEKALGKIQRGAEEWLEAMRAEKQKLESGGAMAETALKLIGHIEKVEVAEDDVPEQKQTVPKHKDVEDDTTMEEENLLAGPCRCKMQSVSKVKQAALEAKIKEQKRRWEEVTKWRRVTNEALGDMNLEDVMEKMTEAETASTSTSSASASRVVMAEVYVKSYMESAKQRGQRSTARSEHRENLEREQQLQRQKEEEERIVKECEEAEQRKVVEKALLEEEEQKQEELLTELHQRGKEEKKKKQEKESRKQKYQEDEEEQFIDDEDRDPDFDPDKEEDVADNETKEDKNEEDTFQIEKHSHALNFSEAGEFVVWVTGELEELKHAVR